MIKAMSAPSPIPGPKSGARGFYEDTDPKTLAVFLQQYREMEPGERTARIFEMAAFQENLQRSSV
jgi:hypothetical protein